MSLQAFFQEVSRILKPGGILITSTDYYSDPIDTHGEMAYGVPIHIFSKDEIISALNVAEEYGLELTGNINLDCQEKPILKSTHNLFLTKSERDKKRFRHCQSCSCQ